MTAIASPPWVSVVLLSSSKLTLLPRLCFPSEVSIECVLLHGPIYSLGKWGLSNGCLGLHHYVVT